MSSYFILEVNKDYFENMIKILKLFSAENGEGDASQKSEVKSEALS